MKILFFQSWCRLRSIYGICTIESIIQKFYHQFATKHVHVLIFFLLALMLGLDFMSYILNWQKEKGKHTFCNATSGNVVVSFSLFFRTSALCLFSFCFVLDIFSYSRVWDHIRGLGDMISEHVRKFALDIRVTKYVRVTPTERFLFLLTKVSWEMQEIEPKAWHIDTH